MYNRNIYKSLTITLCVFWLLPLAGLAQENLTVTPIFNTTFINSAYEVKFTTSQALLPNAKFLVTFPGNFDLSKVNMAGSQTINGGFTTTVKDSTILITRSGLGRTILAGEAVQFQFATIRNPGIARDFPVRVEIFADSTNRVAQKESAVKIEMRAEQE